MPIPLLKNRCPYCNQKIKGAKFGIELTPVKFKVFDFIEKHPGWSLEAICQGVFSDLPFEQSIGRVKMAIYQINEIFGERIILGPKTGSKEGYRIGRDPRTN